MPENQSSIPHDLQQMAAENFIEKMSTVGDLKSGPSTKQMTFGEKLVGLTFNPSGDDKVATAKRLCAELADLVYADYSAPKEISPLYSDLYRHTIGEILNAQMNVVKLLTLKY